MEETKTYTSVLACDGNGVWTVNVKTNGREYKVGGFARHADAMFEQARWDREFGQKPQA